MAGRLKIPLSPRDEARMTLIEHLGELRTRIIKVAAIFVLAAIVTWFFRERLFYAFVAPAVGDMGRVTTYVLITLASSLFLAGIAFGYFFVLPAGLSFLLGWDTERYETIITPSFYLAFTTRFLLACGLVFELPAATYVCAKLELIDANLLKRYRKHAIVANTILAAAITPSPDPFTMIMLAVPLIVMYELSIVIARYVNPTTEVTAHNLARTDEDEDEEYDPELHEEDGNERDL